MPQEKPIIVGIDPGSTVGVAFLDLHGNILDVESGKNITFADMVWEINSRGDPLIIGCDRNPAPHTVKKIKASFDCKFYVPREHLTLAEKHKLTKDFKLRNSHEKDALAAALKAFNAHSAKLRQLERQEGADFEKNVKGRLFGRIRR